MTKTMAKPDERRRQANEAHSLVLQGMRNQVTGFLQMGIGLKQIRDGQLYRELGYSDEGDGHGRARTGTDGYPGFLAYLDAEVNVGQRAAYHYIEVVEKFPPELLKRVSTMSQPISLRRLISIDFDPEGITDAELDELVGLSDEEFEKALTEKGYDRSKMGGRGPADLKRELISKAQYRSQKKRLAKLSQERDEIQEEREVLGRELAELKEKYEEVEAALKGDTAKLVAARDKIAARLAELETERAEREAKVAAGARAASAIEVFESEVITLVVALRDNLVIQNREQWRVLLRTIETLKGELDDMRGTLALGVQERIERGEIRRFNVEAPTDDLRDAEFGIK